MILKHLILYCFVHYGFCCIQTAQRSTDAVVQQAANSADSNVIRQNARLLPSVDTQEIKQPTPTALFSQAVHVEGTQSSATPQTTVTRSQKTKKATKSAKVRSSKKQKITSKTLEESHVPEKNNIGHVTVAAEKPEVTKTSLTKAIETVLSSSNEITKSPLLEVEEAKILFPEDIKEEKKEVIESVKEEKQIQTDETTVANLKMEAFQPSIPSSGKEQKAVTEEINLCHTCELSVLEKVPGMSNDTLNYYEPYLGDRTFSAFGCAQTLVYCNVPFNLGKWPDNYLEFYPNGPIYKAVKGGGLASEVSCSKDGHWKVGSRIIVGVSCSHE